MLNKRIIDSHKDVARGLRILGLTQSHPITFIMSNADNASKVSSAVILMVHNCDEGVGSMNGNLKSLSVNVQLKNLLNVFEIA